MTIDTLAVFIYWLLKIFVAIMLLIAICLPTHNHCWWVEGYYLELKRYVKNRCKEWREWREWYFKRV